ncbi:MAG: glycoside hydrolase family 3 C-terminal domain-containing protein, partial [Cyclobacteriaceae bacterium]|nr:glycoside hydrolase family 3 C-terminal domain-containing protein [Cyclobacteriaceae bacterium]
VEGYQFKDLNKNGQLDLYEDWRLSTHERVQNLLSQMTLDEKVGFMLISSIVMNGGGGFGRGQSNSNITSELSEKDVEMSVNFFTKKTLPAPMLSISGTTKGIMERQLRHFILRTNASAKMTADWSNNLQTVAESSRLGIPVIVASNPRNHVSMDNAVGLSFGETTFSTWPGELGIAAMRDLELTREFAEIAAKEWTSIGLRKGYQYMADLATEPRWSRNEGTFGEDADLAADIIREITLGFQGEKLGPHSVALTTKHFPGGGPQIEGQDPHFDWGKEQHYPGGMFDYHLKPFIAAIEAGTSAIMPYYAKPVRTEFEEVAFAYNYGVITELLRNKLGFEGIINSDTGPIYMMPWGVEDLSLIERYKKALMAGVDIFSGTADPTILLETVKSGVVTEERINESVARLLKEKFELGIFENPYVDPVVADSIAGNEVFQKKADLALRKSIVLLRNDESLLPLKPKTKVYLETYYDNRRSEQPGKVIVPEINNWEVQFVNNIEEADVAILWLIPTNGGLFQSTGDPIDIRLSQNRIDIEYVNKIKSTKPTVLAINFTSPWVIEEIDDNNTQTIIATFGTTLDALLDVATGKFNPTGKMPITIPVSKEAVEKNRSDVPGYKEEEGYALFKFGDGLSY